MMKACDWMKPARRIFDFQKDWGELRGVRKKLGKNLHEKCFLHRKTLGCFTFIFPSNVKMVKAAVVNTNIHHTI